MLGLWTNDDYGALSNRVCWTFFALTAVIVGLRVHCRLHYGRRGKAGLGIDDYITAACLALTLIVCILISIGAHHGLGRHADTLDPADMTIALKYNVIINAIVIWQFSLPKFAIIAILKRILNHGTRTTVLFWGLGLSSQACFLATSVWWFEQCDPVEFGWDKTIAGGTCADVSVLANLGYFTSAYSAFLDLFFALYPVPFIMRLNMPLRSRIAVSVALSLGSLACVVSIIKLAVFGEVFQMLPDDPTYPVAYLDILGISEGCILIICASFPALGPLFRSARGKLTSQNSTNTKSNKNFGSSAHSLRKSWAHVKGHRIEDPERMAGHRGDSSIDDVPLVSSPKGLVLETYDKPGIQKTVDFSIISEPSRTASPPHANRLPRYSSITGR